MLNGAVRVNTFSCVPVRMATALVGDFFQGLSGYPESMAVHEIPAEVTHATQYHGTDESEQRCSPGVWALPTPQSRDEQYGDGGEGEVSV